jgi:septation ring formation regulator EzrA
MPIIQGELGDLTAEEAEAREQGVKSVKEELAKESRRVRTIVLPMVPGEGEEEPEPEEGAGG